jgi:hypothetical protein
MFLETHAYAALRAQSRSLPVPDGAVSAEEDGVKPAHVLYIRPENRPHIITRLVEVAQKLVREKVWKVTFEEYEPQRSLDQNSKLHAMVQDIASQVQWAGEWMDVTDWKRLFSAALYGQKVVPSLDGQGFTIIVRHTSDMKKKECSDLIEFITAWAAERGVVFKDERRAEEVA